MATVVLNDASVTIGGTDLSDHVRSVTIDYSADAVEDTNMGDDTHIRKGGLKDWSISIEFAQDYAASSVDATLFSSVGSTVAFVGKPTSGAVSSTNPSYSGTALLESYQPLNGSIGELSTASVSMPAAGDLTRATS